MAGAQYLGDGVDGSTVRVGICPGKEIYPGDFYMIGKLILSGFLIPFRPVILIPLREEKEIGEGLANITAFSRDLSGWLSAGGQKERGTAFFGDGVLSAEGLIFGIWAAGCMGMVLYQTLKYAAFLRRVKRWSHAITDREILTVFTERKERMGIRARLPVRECACIFTPMLVGIFRPVILLPHQAVPPRQLEAVLDHELMHYKRKDLWYRWAMMAAVAVNWFNPLVYLFARVFAFYGELSCDEAVTEKMDERQREQYLMTVVALAAGKSAYNTAFSSSFYGGKEGMKKRIYSVMRPPQKRLGYGIFAVCFLLVLSSGVVFTPVSDGGEHTAPGIGRQADGITREEVKREIEAAFSESFSVEYYEKRLPDENISGYEDGVPVVLALEDGALEKGVYASVKGYRGRVYSSSDCAEQSLAFCIPEEEKAKVLDSADFTDVVKISYAGLTGYMKKSELKF